MILLGFVLATAGATAKGVTVTAGKDDAASGVAYLRYFPETVVIHAGESVSWEAGGQTPHTATSDPDGSAFDSSPAVRLDDPELAKQFGPGGFLLAGQSFNHTFGKAGTFVYVCKIHPGMQGTITVVDAIVPSTAQESVMAGWGSGDTSVDRFQPNNLTIEKGTNVVWTNGHSSEPHTVTGTSPDDPFDSSPQVTQPGAAFMGAQGVLWNAATNKAFAHEFADAGTYQYFCKLHPAMWGTVIVLAKSGANSPGLSMPLLLGAVGALALLVRARRR